MADGRQGQVGEKAAASLAADLALEAQLVAAACQQVLDRQIQVVCTDQAQLPGAAHEVGAVVTRQLLGPAVQAQDVEGGVEAGGLVRPYSMSRTHGRRTSENCRQATYYSIPTMV